MPGSWLQKQRLYFWKGVVSVRAAVLQENLGGILHRATFGCDCGGAGSMVTLLSFYCPLL